MPEYQYSNLKIILHLNLINWISKQLRKNLTCPVFLGFMGGKISQGGLNSKITISDLWIPLG
jgi:hypothetical protein